MKLNGGQHVDNTLPPSSMIPPNCWGDKRVRMGQHVTTCRPVIVALHHCHENSGEQRRALLFPLLLFAFSSPSLPIPIPIPLVHPSPPSPPPAVSVR